MTAVKRYEDDTPAPVAVTPMEMIQQAVANGGGVEMVEKLMTLQDRWEASQGRKEFDQAIAAAKAKIPVIQKNRDGHNSRYADFAAYARAVDPILSEHGLSYRFRTTQENGIRVTCILSHSAGHSEESTLAGPADKSGSKNDIQAIGSTLTYLQRYTLVQALGLAASDDDDGQAAGNNLISDEQVKQLQKAMDDVGSSAAEFCAFANIESLPELPASKFNWAKQAISQYKRDA